MHEFDYTILDQKVCQLAGGIETNILSFVNPTNMEDEKRKFLQAAERGQRTDPVFTYAPRNSDHSYFAVRKNFQTYKNELKELLNEIPQDSTLGLIFERKIVDLFERMELIRSIGTENFSGNSETYYGSVDNAELKLAKELVQKKTSEENRTIAYDASKQIVEGFLRQKRLPYRVKPKPTGGSRFSVNLKNKEVLISPNALLSPNELKRLIAHEIEGHIYRYENGSRQSYRIFSRGLSKETLQTEEGIAVLVEQKENINVNAQLKEYAGRTIAISAAMRWGFYETFEEMTKWFTPEEAFTLTLRAKRGTYSQQKGGAFTKDSSYLKGMLSVEQFSKDVGIMALLHGRYSVYDVPLVLDVDGLKEPKHIPASVKKS